MYARAYVPTSIDTVTPLTWPVQFSECQLAVRGRYFCHACRRHVLNFNSAQLGHAGAHHVELQQRSAASVRYVRPIRF